MDLRLIYAIILTLLPISELRVGLPLGVLYALENNMPVFLIFSVIVLLNILIIFFIFWFLDNLHTFFMRFGFYHRSFEIFLKKFQKKVDKFERRYDSLGFLALIIFVAIPLPGTGAWTGCLLAWLLGLDRKKSIMAISLGIVIAGVLILLASLGFINLFL